MKIFIYISSFLLSLIVLGSAQSLAQNAKLDEAVKELNSGNLDKAKTAIDIAAANSETNAQAKTWYFRAFIYKEVYKNKESNNVTSPSRKESLASVHKALKLDTDKKYEAECKKLAKYLSTTLYNDGVKSLNDQNFKDALAGYTGYLDALQIAEPDNKDVTAIFYSGYSAYMLNDIASAIEYFEQARALKYDDPNLYFFLSKVYRTKGDKARCNDILEKGQALYPTNKDLVLTQVNYYLEDHKIKELEDKLVKAIKLDPKNTQLYMTLSLVYEKQAESEASQRDNYIKKAEENYKKVLQLEPNNLTANYNLATMYYNLAVTKIKELEYDIDFEQLGRVQEECVDIFKKSLPYMTKAYELDPNKSETLEGLAGIYHALNDMPKSNEFRQKLESLKKN